MSKYKVLEFGEEVILETINLEEALLARENSLNAIIDEQLKNRTYYSLEIITNKGLVNKTIDVAKLHDIIDTLANDSFIRVTLDNATTFTSKTLAEINNRLEVRKAEKIIESSELVSCYKEVNNKETNTVTWEKVIAKN